MSQPRPRCSPFFGSTASGRYPARRGDVARPRHRWSFAVSTSSTAMYGTSDPNAGAVAAATALEPAGESSRSSLMARYRWVLPSASAHPGARGPGQRFVDDTQRQDVRALIGLLSTRLPTDVRADLRSGNGSSACTPLSHDLRPIGRQRLLHLATKPLKRPKWCQRPRRGARPSRLVDQRE